MCGTYLNPNAKYAIPIGHGSMINDDNLLGITVLSN